MLWKRAGRNLRQDYFDRVILPHRDAAYNLAYWLLRSDQDAEDAVQEACVRAFRHAESHRGAEGRAWLLKIVRNTCYTMLQQQQTGPAHVSLDDAAELLDSTPGPETVVLQQLHAEQWSALLHALPLASREIVILRDVEGLSYREIGDVIGIPIGTVMSRLARARRKLCECAREAQHLPEEAHESKRNAPLR